MSGLDEKALGDADVSGPAGVGEDVCPECDGAGTVGDKPCPYCLGRGKILREIAGA